MTAQKIINPKQDAAPEPIPCRYIQLPTLIVNLYKQYFSLPQTDESRWLPSVRHLRYYDEQAPFTDPTKHGPTEDQFADQIEINRVESYTGDRHTDLPKILVRRGGVLKVNNAISDQLRQGPNGSIGKQYYGHIYTLSVVTFAFSRDAGQSEHIAAECEQLLSHFSPTLRKEFCLQRFRVNQVGDIGRIKEFPQFFATPMVVDIQYEDNVQLVDGNMPIRYLNLKLSF
jgi:hypothetical protein